MTYQDLPQGMKNEEVKRYWELLQARRAHLAFKRCFDVAVSFLILLILSPFLLLLALAAFPHHDLTMFALGGIAVWCLMPERDPKEKRQSDRS